MITGLGLSQKLAPQVRPVCGERPRPPVRSQHRSRIRACVDDEAGPRSPDRRAPENRHPAQADLPRQEVRCDDRPARAARGHRIRARRGPNLSLDGRVGVPVFPRVLGGCCRVGRTNSLVRHSHHQLPAYPVDERVISAIQGKLIRAACGVIEPGRGSPPTMPPGTMAAFDPSTAKARSVQNARSSAFFTSLERSLVGRGCPTGATARSCGW
jgi:hypothetical protein